ncbi:hypothetical protein [Leptolyngbya sp. FACHB-711]|nr:hypothetical protein [Leptolyngbya sp. FACHB-711]
MMELRWGSSDRAKDLLKGQTAPYASGLIGAESLRLLLRRRQ